MKLSDPGRFALAMSALLSILVLVLFASFSYFTDQHITQYEVTFTLIALVVFSAASFFLLNQYVENYIYKKIRVIYKTIHQFKKTSKDLRRPKMGQDTIEKVNQEVMNWQKHTYQQIEDLKLRAQYRREFIGNVSHELKTPIFNIQGYILTLLDGAVDDPDINRQYLERTENSVNRLISIIEDLEDISQLESGNLKLNTDSFNVIDIARDVMEQLEMKSDKRGISLFFRKKYEKPIHVTADRNRIRQVFTNLVENSIKYGKENGTTKVSFFDMYDHILCEVSDDGPGIAEESVPRIFERFFRTDKARSREQGGSGLGLAIVKHILEAHDQTINVRSKLGAGTTFAFTLKKAP